MPQTESRKENAGDGGSGSPADVRGAKRRRRTLLALGALLLSFLATALVVAERRDLAGWLLLRAIRHAGVEETSLVVAQLQPGSLEVRDIRLGSAPDLRIDALELRGSPLTLLRTGQVDSLRVSGVWLRASVREGRVSFGALAPLVEAEPMGLPLGVPRRVELTDARIELDTARGPVLLPFAFAFELLPDGTLGGDGSLELLHAAGHAALELHVTGRPNMLAGRLTLEGRMTATPELPITSELRGTATLALEDRTLEIRSEDCLALRVESLSVGTVFRLRAPFSACLSAQEDPLLRAAWPRTGGARYEAQLALAPTEVALTAGAPESGVRINGTAPALCMQLRGASGTEPVAALESSGGALRAPDYGFEAKDLSLSAHVSAHELEATLRVDRLRDTRTPARIAPLELTGRVVRTAADPLAFTVELASAGRALTLEASGSYEPEVDRLHASFRMHPLELGGLLTRPAALFPFLGSSLRAERGRLELTGRADSAPGGVNATLDIAVRDLALATAAAHVTGVNGRFQLDGPFPLSTPPDQLLSIGLLDVGLPLTAGLVRFRLRPEGVLEVYDSSWRVAGGLVRTAGSFDLRAPQREVVLRVQGIELEKLAAQIDLEGLEGAGTLDGTIPLVHTGAGVQIQGAELHGAPGGGRIRYRPAGAAAARMHQSPKLETALSALEDFHYETLRLTLDGDARGSVTLGVHLRGSNPRFQDGRPVEFNLNLEARLSDLLQASLTEYRIPQVIEQRLREFSESGLP